MDPVIGGQPLYHSRHIHHFLLLDYICIDNLHLGNVLVYQSCQIKVVNCATVSNYRCFDRLNVHLFSSALEYFVYFYIVLTMQ